MRAAKGREYRHECKLSKCNRITLDGNGAGAHRPGSAGYLAGRFLIDSIGDDPQRHVPSTLDLDDYFGHLYPLEHCLLVASSQRLFCVATDGIVKWSSRELGIDGVVVSRVWDAIIDGEGQWDPPGGWKPFRIRLDTGSRILQSR
jgi:hypothetical protein